ncbi:diguanylate phosphodiesterase [Pandoraea terrae]|uniref:Diguanylate phosphodiesterase n=2 Tax=Pandoraea terrae TaxID=1537710 RepID=A0A5E4X997_9BURK|nr:diguanylate phosphodiesterase [Pandoraea terrae]
MEGDRAVGHFRGLRLRSHFQPIYSPAHRRIVGHEALLRATDGGGAAVPPPQAFSTAQNDSELVFLDRLCRALHLHNYRCHGDGDTDPTWLFLNVSTQILSRHEAFGGFFAELLDWHNFPASRVVVEILEGAIPDLSLLSDAVAWYRDMGCLVALDDFGANASDIERIWRAGPDIVKLDRKVIAAAAHSAKARRVLPAVISLIHEAGSLALIEGVENPQQAAIALDCDIDLVQGFHFSRPAAEPLHRGDGGIAELMTIQTLASAEDGPCRSLEPYVTDFKRVAWQLREGSSMSAACAQLLARSRLDRCYLIDAAGVQIGASLLPPGRELTASRFAPMEGAAGANWSRKPYHYRALAQPGELQISRPYLSVANSRMCVTLSLALRVPEGLRVLCCDINWEDG